jgi:hypothetical protein
MKLFTLISLVFALTVFTIPSLVSAQSSPEKIQTQHEFVKKRYTIHGTAELSKSSEGVQIAFSEDFKTKGGPDLKIYLSKKSLSELDNESVDENSLKISVLKSKKGAQSYILPEDITLSDYKSIIIHCEAFSVLWGGFDLP